MPPVLWKWVEIAGCTTHPPPLAALVSPGMASDVVKCMKCNACQVCDFICATVNGQVGNFRVEPPGLFRGRGDHPKMGFFKRRIYPRDITINIGARPPDLKLPPLPQPSNGSHAVLLTLQVFFNLYRGRGCSDWTKMAEELFMSVSRVACQLEDNMPDGSAIAGPGEPIPEHPYPGQQWAEVRHDNTVTWLAYWKDQGVQVRLPGRQQPVQVGVRPGQVREGAQAQGADPTLKCWSGGFAGLPQLVQCCALHSAQHPWLVEGMVS